QHHKAVLVTNVADVTAIQPKLQSFYNSYVAVPLLLGERFIGTLELANRQAGSFSQAQLAMLQAVSKQVTISIYNTELYGEQAQRINDMATIGALTNLNET